MPPSVNKSNAKHYEEPEHAPVLRVRGSRPLDVRSTGWEPVADHALEWALATAAGGEVPVATPA